MDSSFCASKTSGLLRNANRKERNIDFKGIVNPPYGSSSPDFIIDSWSISRVEQEPTQVSSVIAAVWLQAEIVRGGDKGRIKRLCSNSLTSRAEGWNEGRSHLHRRLEETCHTSCQHAVIWFHYFNCRVPLVTNPLLSWNLSPEWFCRKTLKLIPWCYNPSINKNILKWLLDLNLIPTRDDGSSKEEMLNQTTTALAAFKSRPGILLDGTWCQNSSATGGSSLREETWGGGGTLVVSSCLKTHCATFAFVTAAWLGPALVPACWSRSFAETCLSCITHDEPANRTVPALWWEKHACG